MLLARKAEVPLQTRIRALCTSQPLWDTLSYDCQDAWRGLAAHALTEAVSRQEALAAHALTEAVSGKEEKEEEEALTAADAAMAICATLPVLSELSRAPRRAWWELLQSRLGKG